jgi:hypothetical protein
MSLIFATKLTAGATAALAVFAIVTAVFAILAFRKQSKEVSSHCARHSPTPVTKTSVTVCR